MSAGERQLLTIARALVKREAKLVLMDEATASLDPASDALVQTALRKAFTLYGATVLVIAHRVHTVMDCDLILGLKDGMVVEFAPPGVLLGQDDSLFAGLVRESSSAVGTS